MDRFDVVALMWFEVVEDVERHKSNDALTIRWDFPYVIASVSCRNRLYPHSFVLFKVRFSDIAAVFLTECVNLVSDFALVELFSVGVCDKLECASCTLVAEDFAWFRSSAVRHECIVPELESAVLAHVLFESLCVALDGCGKLIGNSLTFVCVCNRRLHYVCERELTELIVDCCPCSRNARNCDRSKAELWHCVQALILHLLCGNQLRSAACGIKAVHLAVFCCENCVSIAADAVGLRFENCEARCHCDSRVKSVATLLEDVKTCLSRKMVGRCTHAVYAILDIALGWVRVYIKIHVVTSVFYICF